MKKVLLFYFTGTGNTEEVMRMLAGELKQRGVQADSCRIDGCVRSGGIPDLSGYDALGIGYPVYAFNVPSTVAKWVRLLPRGEGMPVYVFKTAGEPFRFNRPSSLYIDNLLRKKGYDPAYERLFLMPYNIMYRYQDTIVKEIYLLSQKLAGRMAEDMQSGMRCRPQYDPFLAVISVIFRIQWPGARLNGRLMHTGETCTRCGKCVRECPTGNIRLENGKIRFGFQCTMCMRCVMFCPSQAVKAGLLEPWAVRGAYDFGRIAADPSIPCDAIEQSKKGVFRHFQHYVSELKNLTGGCR